ncbi:MAG: DUF3791 domain-containing protein [Propionibacteriaceae bacterium]|jgi:acetyl-CoA carboxylase beta subunit|nr:DUF3791 domain-containing protein [Propionibacteriaceae bacterium]
MAGAATATLTRSDENRVRYVVAAISEFARHAKLTPRQAHRYLADHGAIEFLEQHYEAEHLLSFDDAVEDLLRIAAQAGGTIR